MPSEPKGAWEKALRTAADPLRAKDCSRRLGPLLPENYFQSLSAGQARVVAALFSGSRALSELLLTRPEWIEVIELERLESPRRVEGLRREARAFLKPALAAGDYSTALAKLREFKQREFLRIAARDLAGLGTLPQVIEEISNVADTCIHAVYEVANRQLTEKFGQPYARDPVSGKWDPSAFCILGMGKHGGQELNYSSDIDVLFVYSGEGTVFKSVPKKGAESGRGMANHQFYARLSEAIIAECTRLTAEGFLFRIDLRLRPEGKTAPLARSVSSYENYYAQWGQTWERMMLIKARCVGGEASLGAEFLDMAQSFRYPRSISEEIPREVAEMKQRIENEVVRSGELERNVKLGRGGIREIEFLVQTLQVLQAGRLPFLQGARTLPILDKLRDYHLIEPEEVNRLKEAYCFLRNVEHRLQMEDNRQTHTIPANQEAQTRLARLMGFATLASFETQLRAHNDGVRAAYDKVVKPGGVERALPDDVSENATRWREILAEHSFRDPEQGVRLVNDFVQGPGFGHRSSRTVDHSLQLLTRFLEMCPKTGDAAPAEPFLSDPDRVLTRLDAFVAKYGARSMLYEAWVGNSSLFRLLLLAFDRSEFLAELAIRVPDLIDEIEQSGQLRRRKTKDQILEDLRHGANDPDQRLWLRRYFQAEQMRVGLRDILDLASAEQTQNEISELADAYLTYALEIIMRKHRLRKPPFAVLGLGKLGGGELIYASDLDILFVAEDRASNLPALQKLAVEFMELLSKRTEHGTTFETDARLRPDGEKGLLVNTIRGCAEYYKKRAMLWEIQTLSRCRPITGGVKVLEAFMALVREITNLSGASNWKPEIHRMRLRIQNERTSTGKNALAIKTGSGGLMDVEFIAQAICLEKGWSEPNTLRAIERAGREKVLAESAARTLAENYRWLMRVERILRRWSFAAESMLPEDPAAFYRVSVRCGFSRAADFQRAARECRAAIRGEYTRYFGATT
jgi:glutamate-ammonia-ligase adenylyltransferase